jgi:hypothetical protein
MTVETPLPASAAGTPTMQSFGSASVRLFAPQYVFEMVRSAHALRGAESDVRWPAALPLPSAAANQNGQPQRNDAA